MPERDLYVGLMSGTSLDGVDAVVVDFGLSPPVLLGSASRPFDASLRAELLALNQPADNEIDRAARAGNTLAQCYALAVADALASARLEPADIRAVGCHGQTVRHRPEAGYTIQIGNAALLAERCGIEVVSDFRSADIAAHGQGAPLAPGFHAAMFAHPAECRVVLNLGGIANLTFLAPQAAVTGFDCGPANCLLDLWASRHLGRAFDAEGAWAAGGTPVPELLARLLAEPYFAATPPKSTGRDLFDADWLARRGVDTWPAQDVQATLVELSARTVVDALRHAPRPVDRIIACGGGTRNAALLARIATLAGPLPVETSERHGIDSQLVEATAFAWLARRRVRGEPGNLCDVTGAARPRVLGALYAR